MCLQDGIRKLHALQDYSARACSVAWMHFSAPRRFRRERAAGTLVVWWSASARDKATTHAGASEQNEKSTANQKLTREDL